MTEFPTLHFANKWPSKPSTFFVDLLKNFIWHMSHPYSGHYSKSAHPTVQSKVVMAHVTYFPQKNYCLNIAKIGTFEKLYVMETGKLFSLRGGGPDLSKALIWYS